MIFVDFSNAPFSGLDRHPGVFSEDFANMITEERVFAQFGRQDKTSSSKQFFRWLSFCRICIGKLLCASDRIEIFVVHEVDVMRSNKVLNNLMRLNAEFLLHFNDHAISKSNCTGLTSASLEMMLFLLIS